VTDSVIVINYGNAFPDTLELKQEVFLRGEEKLEPINSIDCIIISAVSERVVQIASKVMEYNINTVILGDTGWWSNDKVFVGGEKYIEGSYVVALSGELSNGTGMSYFSGIPGIFMADSIPLMKGADVCNLLIYCFQNGAHDPDSIAEMLCSIKDFQGVSSRITIDPIRRLNNSVEFIYIQNGSYIKVSNEILNDRMEKTDED